MLNLEDYDVPEDAKRLKDLLRGVLQTVEGIFAANNMPLPARRYTSMAPSGTVDCEQVVVGFVNAYLGPPGDEAGTPVQCNSVRSAVVNVQIAREFPNIGTSNGGRSISIPEAHEIADASDISAIDAWLLVDNLEQFEQWGGDGFGRGMGVIATVNSEKPSGNIIVVSLQLTLAVS